MDIGLEQMRKNAIEAFYTELSSVEWGSEEELRIVKCIDILQKQDEDVSIKLDELGEKEFSRELEKEKLKAEEEEKKRQRRADIAFRIGEAAIGALGTIAGWLIIATMHRNSIVADSFGTLQKGASFKLIPTNPSRV